MTYAYKSRDLAAGTPTSCVASSVTALTGTIGISDQDSLHFLGRISLSAIAVTTAISFELQDSFDGGNTWELVGAQSKVTVPAAKSFTAGVIDIETTTFVTFASCAQGDYFTFATRAGATYAAWIDKNANGTAPTGANYVAATNKIKIPAVTGDNSAAKVAARAVAAIGTIPGITILDNLDGTVTFTQTTGGVTTAQGVHNTGDTGAGSIATAVGTAGTDGNVNTSTDVITSTTHGYVTGQRIIYAKGTQVVAGLVDGASYYIIKLSADTYSLAATYARAFAGTAIDLTAAGVGTAKTYVADHEIQMIIEDASDQAQMPLWPKVRMVANTGSGDTCTVSNVWMATRH